MLFIFIAFPLNAYFRYSGKWRSPQIVSIRDGEWGEWYRSLFKACTEGISYFWPRFFYILAIGVRSHDSLWIHLWHSIIYQSFSSSCVPKQAPWFNPIFPDQGFLTYNEWIITSVPAPTFWFLVFFQFSFVCFILFSENKDHVFHQIFKETPKVLRKVILDIS